MASGERAIRVLSLDGGGVRGLSSLVILQHLVRLVQLRLGPSDDHGEVLPSELFDHIVGTSTGGLIAVMLVKLNMPVSACIKEYKELIPRIFGKRQFGSCIGGLGVPRYAHEIFRNCVQSVFDKYGQRDSGTIRFMEEGNIGGTTTSCTIVCRELHPSGRRMHQPAFICSHYCRSTPKESGKYMPYELWMTCRATTAAPTFFAPIVINRRIFVDGAFGNTSNPTRKAHFHFLTKVTGYKECPVVWLNIGTGSPRPQCDAASTGTRRSSTATIHQRNWKDRLIPNAIREARNLLRDLEAIATDSDRVEEEMEDVIDSKANEQPMTFARVSANNGVADVQLDDWRSLGKIEHLTHLYLEQPDVVLKLERMADLLATETLKRRQAQNRKKSLVPDTPPALPLPVLPFLSTSPDEVSPLPSPIITISQPRHRKQHSSGSQEVSPLEPSPISPLTRAPTNETPIAHAFGTAANISPPIAEHADETLTALSKQEQGPSKPKRDLLGNVDTALNTNTIHPIVEKRFWNLQGKHEMDEKWKRRSTVV
ncbi:hypothetical protein LTR05_006176 [Lithohypha guttulata]|uniref:PNPLA domain-containing protein n=1 Tax=Lithohypha guttulata TaxID=1690604 RepID=A0AAN7YFD2_9EURO|nr:hypothetical protein LTR05_006176 [Lithohypha guttulata]